MEATVDVERERNSRTRGVAADGASIRHARWLLGLTQEAVATAARCDEKTIRRPERTCRNIATLLRIAQALEIPYENIVEVRARDDVADVGAVLQQSSVK